MGKRVKYPVKVRIQIKEAKNSYQIENLRDVSRVFRYIQGRVIQKFKRWTQKQDWTYPLDLIVSHMRYAWESRREKGGEIYGNWWASEVL